jgi:signal peptidase I
MLQLVHDTNYLSTSLQEAGWPSRWQSPAGAADPWKIEREGKTFTVAAKGAVPAWLRYQHLTPEEWPEGRVPSANAAEPQLIKDFYAYNATWHHGVPSRRTESNWVGDLAIEADVQLQSETGYLWLDLVEGGRHFECRIDIATGEARLSVDGGKESFDQDAGGEQGSKFRTAPTSLRGPGNYHLRLANCDDRVDLWVNHSPVTFAPPATYASPAKLTPYYRAPNEPTGDRGDPGDSQPAGIGAQGAELTVTRLKVLRDVYYTATEVVRPELGDEFTQVFRDELEYTLEADQFMPLGDNSPASSDARLWHGEVYSVHGVERRPAWREPFVRRELLTGKAFAIYWPHCWYVPVPYTTNIWPLTPYPARMGRIK